MGECVRCEVVCYAAVHGHWLLPELLREVMYNELIFYFYLALVEGAYRHHSEGLWAAWGGADAEHERGRGEKTNMSLNATVRAACNAITQGVRISSPVQQIHENA